MNEILAILTAVINSLWQAAAVAAIVWAALRFWPRTNAATRYAIWWATLAVILILPAAPHWIATMRHHTLSKAPKPKASVIPAPPVPDRVGLIVIPAAPRRAAQWPIAVLGIWAAILTWRLYQVGRSYLYLRRVKRRAIVSAIPLPNIPRRADLLISREIASPMALGFLRPAVVLPESLLAELSDAEREHVLLHEASHLVRRDDWANLATRLLAGTLALHPVAIWILWRIDREREIACDEWVVSRTGAARPYAASLARLFNLLHGRGGQMLASGIFGRGSRIGDRIEALLRSGRAFSPHTSANGLAVSAVALLGLLLAGSFTPRWIAFAQTAPRLAFEVASVKPSGPNDQFMYRLQPGGRYIATAQTLKNLLANAWSVPLYRVAEVPRWGDSDKFNIEAKVGIPLKPWPDSNEQLNEMLRSLLEERFRLAVHWETRQETIYSLVTAKGGFKLKPAAEGESPGFEMEPGRIHSMAVPLSYLAGNLSTVRSRTVLDKTGLDGKFDYTLSYAPDGATPDDDRSSLYTALDQQLGLRLESARGPVEFLVIDRAEKPDAN